MIIVKCMNQDICQIGGKESEEGDLVVSEPASAGQASEERSDSNRTAS